MKKTLLFTILMVFGFAGFAQQWNSINNSPVSPIHKQLIESGEDQITIDFNLPGFFANSVETPRGKATIISVPKMVSMLETSAPDLPFYAVSAIIGDQADMSVDVINSKYTDFENFEIAPSKGNFSRKIDPTTVPYTYGEMYDQNAFYPAQRADLQEPYILRDYRGQAVSIYPFAYNPVTKTLRVFHEMTVAIVKTGTGGENQLSRRSQQITTDPEFKYLYDNHFINYSEAQSRYAILEEEGNMIVICHGPYMDAMAPFVAWKKTIGRPIEMFDVAAIGSTPADIKSFITDYYNTNGLTHILLVGDHQHVPSYNNSSSGGYSDNYYTYLEGNDSYNEAFVGRFSAETPQHVTTMVNRLIKYERDMDETDTWLSVGTGLARNEGAGGGHNGGEADYVHIDYIRDSLLNYTYTTVHREYDGGVPGVPNTSASQISQRINAGTSIMNYCNHGSQNSWSVAGYSSTHVNALTNTIGWPVIWSVACDNGKFTNGSCFAEAWTRAEHNGEPTGAIGTMMSWISQPWTPPMTGQDEMVTILVEGYANNIKRTLGGNSINGSMIMLDLHGSSGRSTHDTWILFGDPSMTMRTAAPTPIAVTHQTTLFLGMTDLAVTADAENAIVTLTKNGEILTSAYVTGGQANLNFPALDDVGMLTISVFGYNKITYLSEIEVIPAEGPFIGYVSYEINDEAGNNNGMIDYSESIILGITLQNLGVETASDLMATLSTENPYVTFSDNSQSYGAIAPGEEKSIADAFSFTVSDDIPDMTSIAFELEIVGADDTWDASFSIKAHAPAFTIGTYMIADDIIGNSNGQLDPGETARIIVNIQNSGSSSAPEVLNELTLNNPFVTVNEGSYLIPELIGGAGTQAFFEVSVSPTAPIGTVVDFSCTITAGAYTAEKSFVAKIGLVIEDFETGDFGAFDWESGGNLPWTVTGLGAYEGTYAAKSGSISHNQSSAMILPYEVSVDDSISFYTKVSSESGYDKLSFYIDNSKVGEWSGTIGWTRVAYPVSAGIRSFKWEYKKDVSVSGGTDNAHVDYIVLPASISMMAYAGNDAMICQGDDLQLEGAANHYASLEWITSGTGEFSDPVILDPIYTPSQADIDAGAVTLTLIATAENDDTLESSLILTISMAPEAVAGTEGVICKGETFELTEAAAADYSAILWETNGTGTFDNPEALNPVYTPSEADYASGSVELNLTAFGAGTCADATSSLTLSFHSLPTAMLEGDQAICEGEEASMTISLTGDAPWTVTMADGMGNYEIPSSPFMMTMVADEPMTMHLLTVTDMNGCTNDGEGSATITLNYAPASPVAPMTVDSVDYAETTQSMAQIEAVENATAYEWMLEPANAGTFEGQGMEVTINWNTEFIGNVMVMARAQNECGFGEWSPATEVVLTSTVGLYSKYDQNFVLYPNPSDGNIHLDFGNEVSGKLKINVTNTLGKVVFAEEVDANTINGKHLLELQQLDNGVYLIQITAINYSAVKQLVIRK